DRVPVLPARPVIAIVILRQLADDVLRRIPRIRSDRIRIPVMTNQRAEDLLRLAEPRRVVQRMAQVVVDAGELLVLRELSDDALEQGHRGPKADAKTLAETPPLASAPPVGRRKPVHRRRRALRVRVCPRVTLDELLEPLDRLLARLLQALCL